METNAGSQPSLRSQLFESTAVLLDIIKELGPSGLVDLGNLDEGLRSLQDTLIGSAFFSTPELDPFYFLCLQLCDTMTKQASPNGDASQITDISVIGYGLGQLQELLLASFHALSTYLNIIRCAPGRFNNQTKRRSMACIACAIRDLEKHRTHLNNVDESLVVVGQLYVTATCLSMFYKRLRDFGVDRYQQDECGCISQRSNRMFLVEYHSQ